ncbi:MAG: peptidoglycan D,D-transpeptidase FtsI family protein [Planctomycetota bacterium]|jgi:cell division protein FtsI/penicillin-binding protein 2
MEERVVARFRASLVFTFLLMVFGALSGRLFWIQVWNHEAYAKASARQQVERLKVPAARGDLLDRRGRILATSRLVPSLAVDPKVLKAKKIVRPVAAALARVTGVDEARLLRRIVKGHRFAWVKRCIEDPLVVERVKNLELPEGVLIIREEMGRCYPMGPVAAHVLGFCDIDGRGIEGIELSLDRHLHGENGERVVNVDARGARIGIPGSKQRPARRGRDVGLTIDAVIQGFAEDALRRACEEHKPKGASVVVLDAQTGEALALASWPTFDPSTPAAASDHERRARFVADMLEPGSTFKPLVTAAALQAGVLRSDEVLDTGEGWLRIGGRVVHDHDDRGHGPIPVSEILTVSSNVGMAKIGLRLGIDGMHDAVHEFGFGRKTGLGLPGEVKGAITPRKRWTEAYSLVSVSFGQEIAVTPLQLASAYLPITGNGTGVKPTLVRGRAVEAAPQVLSPTVARDVREMMADVVANGTGRPARGTGYRLGGKTGTAQKMGRGGAHLGYVSSFVGFGPVDDPHLLCLVLMDEPGEEGRTPYGSRVAAPATAEILRRSLRYLGVRPDEEGVR